MKKSIFTLVALTCFTGSLMLSCKSSTKDEKETQEKVVAAQENVNAAKDSLMMAKNAATTAEWNAFKVKTDSIINDNKARIAKLKLKIKKSEKAIDVKYQKNIDELERRNNDLKLKMESYKNDANSDWKAFKREFNHDIDEIGQAFKDLTVDNKN